MLRKQPALAWPYRRPADGLFASQSVWRVIVPGVLPDPREFPAEGLEGWGPGMRFTCLRDVQIDVDKVRDEADLNDATTELTMAVSAATAGGRLRETIWLATLPMAGIWDKEIRLDFEVPGADGLHAAGSLALDLTLTTGLYLQQRDLSSGGDLAASIPGSRLYEEVQQLILETDAPALPMVSVSFADKLPKLQAERAPFHVSLERIESPYDSFSDTLLVYLNSDTPFSTSVETLEAVALRRLHDAVVTQLCFHLILNGQLDAEEGPFPPGSTGAVAEHYLRALYGQASFGQMRSSIAVNPSEFQTRMDSYLSYLHGDPK